MFRELYQAWEDDFRHVFHRRVKAESYTKKNEFYVNYGITFQSVSEIFIEML